jgi:hypothetical protein
MNWGDNAATRIQPSRSICTVRGLTPEGAQMIKQVDDAGRQEEAVALRQVGQLAAMLFDLPDLGPQLVVDGGDGGGKLLRAAGAAVRLAPGARPRPPGS